MVKKAGPIFGDKWNNRVDNLVWSTTLDNIQHACRTGLRPSGSRSPGAKLTTFQVGDIRKQYRGGRHGNAKALAAEYGVSSTQIHRIMKGRCWNHASSHVGRIEELTASGSQSAE